MPALETRTEKVTVYNDRAQVTRHGRVRLPAGQQELVIEDLPVVLLPDSVRAAIRATEPCRLLSTDVTRTFHAEAPETRVSELQAEVEALQDRDAEAVQRLEALTTRRTFLQTLATSAGSELARGLALGRISVEVGATLGEFLAVQLAALDADARAVTQERRRLSKELQATQSRLQALQRRKPTERNRVVVLVHLEAEAEVSLELSYQVTQASWQPLYDLRLSEKNGCAELEAAYQAQVTQQTGEAWQKVALTLSTARPGLSSIAPELKPWYLRGHRPVAAGAPMMRAWLAEPAAASAAAPAPPAMDEDLLEAAPMLIEAEVEVATVDDTGATLTFNVSGGTDIPDDGSPHKVTLGFHGFPARLDYFAAPKLVTQAYRRAKVTNSGPSTLLPGPAQIFYEGEYIGATSLKAIASGQEFELFLGIDDRITVERKLTAGSVDKKFMQDVRRLTYAYEIRVANLRETLETVTVEDQVPVSRHELVKIRRQEVQPAPTREDDLGKLTWELRLAPGRSATVRFGFTVEAPRDLQLEGLPPISGE